jgi:D-lactate dehydrogenase
VSTGEERRRKTYHGFNNKINRDILSSMKIVFDAVEDDTRKLFEEELASHELVFLEQITPEVLQKVSDARILSVFVSSPLTRAHLEAVPTLGLIAARSTGFDHIDTAYAKERGIILATVPSYGARTVAEYTFALILALSRKAYAAYDRLRMDGTTDVKDYEGFDLAGKRLGIIGTGTIGKNVARIARGFAMELALFDLRPDEAFAREIETSYTRLENLLGISDIISLHVPYLPATHHFVNEAFFAKCKEGSYLINTARGAIVDTPALVRALKEGRIAGAGLDVIEGERELLDETALLSDEHKDIEAFQRLVAAHALLGMPEKVIVTPHIAFNTREAKREIAMTTLQNIKTFIERASL